MPAPRLRSFFTALAFALPVAAFADEIVVKDVPMSGKVVGVNADGLEVETTYGKGNVLVKYADVTTLRTDAPFVVVTGDDGKVTGKLVGVRDGDKLLVGEDEASAQAIPVGTLFPSGTKEKWDSSSLRRAKALFRYWNAKYDLAFGATDSTINTVSMLTGLEVERRKSPTRLLLNGGWRYGTKDDPDVNTSTGEESESVTENEVLGAIRGEYDLTKRFYTFASASAEYDEVEELSTRFIPKAGLGIHIIRIDASPGKPKYYLDADVGGAWVYEDFFGPRDTNRYAAVAFGTDIFLTLPLGMTLTSRGEYLPNVEQWADDYLLNGKATLAFPMNEWLSLTTSVIDQYDATPSDNNQHNSVTLTAGLSLVF
jgi:hypothetical protein